MVCVTCPVPVRSPLDVNIISTFSSFLFFFVGFTFSSQLAAGAAILCPGVVTAMFCFGLFFLVIYLLFFFYFRTERSPVCVYCFTNNQRVTQNLKASLFLLILSASAQNTGTKWARLFKGAFHLFCTRLRYFDTTQLVKKDASSDSSGLLMWGCMSYLSLVSVLPALNDGRESWRSSTAGNTLTRDKYLMNYPLNVLCAPWREHCMVGNVGPSCCFFT